MTLLRLYCSLLDPPPACRWALVREGSDTVVGQGELSTLPRHASQVQVVLPGAQVRFVRTRLPPTARKAAGSALAFAVEEQAATEPEFNQVRWLGQVAGEDVLAVFDQAGFDAWRAAFALAGLSGYQWQAEALLLPWQAERWCLGWNGTEGFVRTGVMEGSATDCGSRASPPLALRLLLQQARADGTAPTTLLIKPTVPEALPDLAAWARELQVTIEPVAAGDWTTAPADDGPVLAVERRRGQWLAGLARRLRPALVIAAAALVLHTLMLLGEWTWLASERRQLHGQLESTFRGAFPDAVAVADPALQMRRKLAQARHAAGQADPGDFLALVGPVSDATRGLPPGSLRSLSHDAGGLTVELSGVDAEALRRIQAQLQQAGLQVETTPPDAGAAGARLRVRAP